MAAMAFSVPHEAALSAPLDLRIARMFADIDTMQSVHILPTKIDAPDDSPQQIGRRGKLPSKQKLVGRRLGDDGADSSPLASGAGSADATAEDDAPKFSAKGFIKLREYEMLEGMEDGRAAMRHRDRIQDLTSVSREKVQTMLGSQLDDYCITSRPVIRDEVAETERRIEQLGLPDPSKVCRRTLNLEVELDWYTSQAVRLHLLSRDYLKGIGEWRDRVEDLKAHIDDLKAAMKTSSHKNRLLKSTMEDLSPLTPSDLHPMPLDTCSSAGSSRPASRMWSCRPPSCPVSSVPVKRPETTSSGCRQRDSSTRAPSTRSPNTPSALLRKPHTAPSIMALTASPIAPVQSAMRSARHLQPLAGTMPDMSDPDALSCCRGDNFVAGSPLEATLLPSSPTRQQDGARSSTGNSRSAGAGACTIAEGLRPHTAPCEDDRARRKGCGAAAPGQNYLDQIAQLTSQLKRRRSDRKQKRARASDAFSRTCGLEEFFLSCMADLRKDMLRKASSAPTSARASSSSAGGKTQKEAVLAILMGSEDLLVFLYEKLFPHRSGALSGERAHSPRPALKLPSSLLQDIDDAVTALSPDVLFGGVAAGPTGSVRTPRVNCA